MTQKPLSHDEAIDALCGCAANVTVLSYQEAIEGYFKLRGIDIETCTKERTDLYDRLRKEGLIDPILVRAQVEALVSVLGSIKAAADALGVHPEHLRMFVRGIRKNPEPKLLKALGLKRVYFYGPVKAPDYAL